MMLGASVSWKSKKGVPTSLMRALRLRPEMATATLWVATKPRRRWLLKHILSQLHQTRVSSGAQGFQVSSPACQALSQLTTECERSGDVKA